MTKMIAIFRVFYCLHIWRRTNGDKWTGQMVKQRENSGMGQMDKWDKWRTNGRTNGGNMDKMVNKHQFGENGTNGRAYVLIYAPICPVSKCPERSAKW